MLDDNKIKDLVDLLVTLDESTKIYIGCDSVKYYKKNEAWARYATVLIVHMNGKHGCRIFSHVDRERDYDLRANRPKMRMITEARKVCEMYLQVSPLIDDFDIEIHLDINTDPTQGSNCAAQEAAGYVLGMTGIAPKLKPEGFAASYGADGVAHGRTGIVIAA
jgi:predicted RNase H-related nuclease YkuK (DUF458 family)